MADGAAAVFAPLPRRRLSPGEPTPSPPKRMSSTFSFSSQIPDGPGKPCVTVRRTIPGDKEEAGHRRVADSLRFELTWGPPGGSRLGRRWQKKCAGRAPSKRRLAL